MREMQQKVFAITGIWASCATLCRTAKRLGLTRQKMRNISLRRSEIERGAYMADISVFHPEMLVFVDETGSERKNSIRRYGYGLRGMTPVQHQLFVHGKRISAIGVLSTRGIEDAYIVEGNVSGATFLQFTYRSLLQPFDGINPLSVVVMDNAAHGRCC